MPSSEKTNKKAPAAGTFGLRPVSQLVRPLIKQALPKKSVIFQQIFDLWPEITAGTEAANSLPEKLVFPANSQKGGCLSLWTNSSAQATELSYNRMALVHRINAMFGYGLLADVKVTAHPGSAIRRPGPTPAKVNSDRGVPSQSLDKILGDISNPSLRTILEELGGVLDPEPVENKDSKGEKHA